MKKLAMLLLVSGSFVQVKAQETAFNQNPNWKKSLDKYEASKDKLIETQGTTEQKTYKAYDWTEAKNERKQQRREFRQQRALARINRPLFWGNRCNTMYDPFWNRGRNSFWIY